MIPVRIDIDFGGAPAALAELAERNADMSPLMREIAGFLLDRVEENFEQEGRPKWRPLKPSTIEQRKAEGKWPGKILQRNAGGLAQSFSSEHDATSATVGSNKVYARTHQLGAKKGEFGSYSLLLKPGKQKDTFKRSPVVSLPWGDIPARPMLGLTDDDREELLEIVRDYERRSGTA